MCRESMAINESMKHIYYIINECIAGNYGIGTYIEQLILPMQKEAKVTIVHLQSTNPTISIDNHLKVRHIHIPKCAGDIYIEQPEYSYLYYRTIFFLLKQYVSREDKNIFHFQYTHVSPLVHLLKEHYKDCVTILTLHYMEWAFVLNGNTKQLRYIIKRSPEDLQTKDEHIVYKSFQRSKNLFMALDQTICVCRYAYNLLKSDFLIPEEKLSLIPNGLDMPSISKSHRSKMSISERIILFIGRLTDGKGIRPLIAAFRLLSEQHPDLRLMIVGDGDYKTYLQECHGIWHRVSFTGKLNHQEVHALYDKASVGVLPSFNEQCSYVAIEMLQHGLPIVGTNSTGLAEMIQDGKNGYKVHIKEDNTLPYDELANKILVCLNNQKVLSTGAKTVYQQHYTAKQMIFNHQKLYRKYE